MPKLLQDLTLGLAALSGGLAVTAVLVLAVPYSLYALGVLFVLALAANIGDMLRAEMRWRK